MKSLYLVGLFVIVAAAVFGLRTAFVDPAPPKSNSYTRIVALAPSMSDTLIALGLSERLVGITVHCDQTAAKNARIIGSFADPNFEAIMELKPDLVLGVPHVMAQPVLKQLAHHVEVYAYQPDSLADIKTVISALSVKLSVENEGNDLLARMDRALLDARASVTGINSQPRTFLIAVSDTPLVVAGKNTFASEIVEALGMINRADDPRASWPVWSLENLLVQPPDLLILANGKVHLAPINKLLSSLNMKKITNAIHVVAPNHPIFQTPSPKLIDDLAYLTRILPSML